MARAFPDGYGMGAVEGLTERAVEGLAARARSAGAEIYLANVNSRTQTVLAGEDGALEGAASDALELGARRTERLKVPVPSHCPLLSGVSEELSRARAEVEMEDPEYTYVTNRTARTTRAAAGVREDLAKSVSARCAGRRDLPDGGARCALFVEACRGGLAGCRGVRTCKGRRPRRYGLRSAAVRVRGRPRPGGGER